MWFLPMLFWCFVGVWIVEKIQLKPNSILPILVVVSVVSFLPLPLRLGRTMYYMLFFYVGYILQRENVSLERFYTLKHSVIVLVLFCLLFPAFTLLKEKLGHTSMEGIMFDNQLIIKALDFSLSKLLQIIYSFAGLAMLFLFVGYKEKMGKVEMPQWLINFGRLCFGVYLLQQFILVGLYDYTTIPSIVGCYWLPLIGFVITLIVSVLIAFLMMKTKTGRFLIG